MIHLAIIVAISTNRVIGKDNGIPWHLPDDLRRFKAITMGKPIIMGRKTHEAIGRVLPHRRNIVMTRNKHWQKEGVEVVSSFNDVLALLRDEPIAYVIGGAEIYKEALPFTKTVHITQLDTIVEGDTFFPELDPLSWQEVSRESHRTETGMTYHFVDYVRLAVS